MSKKIEDSKIESAESGNVDQIRDIIFGSQMRDYEQRFVRLEERVLNETNSLRSETSHRLDALESYIKQEVDSLIDQLSIERGEREEDTRHLTDELSKNATAADKKSSHIQDKLTQHQATTRDALLDQSKSLLAEIQSVRNGLTDSLNKNTDKLQSDKTDRKALADMFSEVAMRLNNDFKLPEGNK